MPPKHTNQLRIWPDLQSVLDKLLSTGDKASPSLYTRHTIETPKWTVHEIEKVRKHGRYRG